MHTLMGFVAQELEFPVNWADKKNEQVRGGKFFDDEINELMTGSDGASILIRAREGVELDEIKEMVSMKPDTYKLIKEAPPNLSEQLSLVAVVGMNAGRLQRMLAEMNGADTVNVYLLKIKDGTYAIAFEQPMQVGIVAGEKKLVSCNYRGMRIWGKEEVASSKC